MNNREIVDRLTQIKHEVKALNTERAELEAQLIVQADELLESSKSRTVEFPGTISKASVTMAQSVKIMLPSYLKVIFGSAYGDMVKESTSYELTAAAKRMLAGLYRGEYVEQTLDEALRQIAVDGDIDTLRKKVKGINFARDAAALQAVTGCSPAEAEENAYLIAEAAVWEAFLRMQEARRALEPDAEPHDANQLLKLISQAVIVEDSIKLAVTEISA